MNIDYEAIEQVWLKPLEILLHKQTNIMNERQMIMINRELIEIKIIFGVACFVSPELIDLEFKIY